MCAMQRLQLEKIKRFINILPECINNQDLYTGIKKLRYTVVFHSEKAEILYFISRLFCIFD